jgi:hypothetical protein
MPEYLTGGDVSAVLGEWGRKWLQDPIARARATADLAALRHTVARPGAACRAADHILAWLGDRRTVVETPGASAYRGPHDRIGALESADDPSERI